MRHGECFKDVNGRKQGSKEGMEWNGMEWNGMEKNECSRRITRHGSFIFSLSRPFSKQSGEKGRGCEHMMFPS